MNEQRTRAVRVSGNNLQSSRRSCRQYVTQKAITNCKSGVKQTRRKASTPAGFNSAISAVREKEGREDNAARN